MEAVRRRLSHLLARQLTFLTWLAFPPSLPPSLASGEQAQDSRLQGAASLRHHLHPLPPGIFRLRLLILHFPRWYVLLSLSPSLPPSIPPSVLRWRFSAVSIPSLLSWLLRPLSLPPFPSARVSDTMIVLLRDTPASFSSTPPSLPPSLPPFPPPVLRLRLRVLRLRLCHLLTTPPSLPLSLPPSRPRLRVRRLRLGH